MPLSEVIPSFFAEMRDDFTKQRLVRKFVFLSKNVVYSGA